MSGIVGIAGKKDLSLLDQMCKAIKHNRQDNIDQFTGFSDLFAAGKIYPDKTPEKRLFFNKEKTACAFLDGRVFNNKTSELIFQSETEQVNFCIDLFEEFGKDFVKKLNGSFIIVIFDLKNKEVIIANDRYGLVPLYIYHNKDKNYLLFSSELKAVPKDKEFKKEIDWDYVAMYFTFDSIYGDTTFFKNVNLLPPATIITCNLKTKEVHSMKYCDFKFSREYDKNKLQTELERKFKGFMKALNDFAGTKQYSMGISLSGGLDSRILLAATDSPVKTFTFGAKGSSEIKVAKKVAKKAKVSNEAVILDPDSILSAGKKVVYLLDGRMSFRDGYNIVIPQKIADKVDIFLTGMGIGECIGGQKLNNKEIFKIDCIDELVSWIYKKRNHGFTEDMMSELFRPEYYQKLKGKAFDCIDREIRGIDQQNCLDTYQLFYLKNEIRRLFLFYKCYAAKLSLSPLHDNTVMDAVLKIPLRYQYKFKFIISFFKKAFPKLSTIPYLKTTLPVYAPYPLHILCYHLKNGFTEAVKLFRKTTKISIENKRGNPDVNEWTRNNKQLRNFINETLLSERTLSRGYFNKDYIEKLFHEHTNYVKDYTTQLFILVMFELWHRYFIDGDSEP